MQIQHLKLKGFKKYRSQKFDFAPGFNLIVGPNEAGKTTLHQAIVTALYGLGKRNSMLLGSKQEAHHWYSKEPPELEIQFVLRNKTYRIIRHLGTGDAKILLMDKSGNTKEILAQTATEVLSVLTASIGIPDASIFSQTVSIHQGQLSLLENLEGVGNAIEQVFSGQDDVDMATVLDRIKQYRKMLKKTRNEKPGRIDLIQARIAQLEEIVAVEQQKTDTETQLAEHVAELEQNLPRLHKEVETLTSRLARVAEKHTLQKAQSDTKAAYIAAEKRMQHLLDLQQAYDKADQAFATYRQLAADESVIEVMRSNIALAANTLERLEQSRQQRLSSRKSMTVLLENRILFVQPWSLVGVLFSILLGLFLVWFFENWWLGSFALGGILWFVVEVLRWRRLSSALEREHKSAEEISLESECEALCKENTNELRHYQLNTNNWHDVAGFTAQVQSYRVAREERQKAEAALLAGLAEQTLAEAKAIRDNLLFEANTITKGLEAFDGFEPTVDEVESWRERLQELEKEIPRLEKDLHTSRGKLQGGASTTDAIIAQRAELDYLRSELSRMGQRYLSTCMALETMEKVVEEYHGTYLPALEKRASDYFKTLTHGHYSKVLLKDSWPQLELHIGDEQVAKTGDLSSGTLDQLYLALRISTADLLTRDDQLLLMMDDPFVNFDTERLMAALRLVAELATKRQVLLMTTDRQFESVVESISNPHVIELRS